MKQTLTFEWKEDEEGFDMDKTRLQQIMQSEDLALSLWEISHNTKRDVEGQIEDSLSDDYKTGFLKATQKFQEAIRRTLDSFNIDIDKLVV